ncbi:hypothetical protein ACGF13_24345 [Kitasatospora sp. NPDC048286]|uniref:hypothetical protein n=1 Tax=Kitasatospora sp. NPDC048286 TaxID=3364047 RepID=UPI00372487AC
MAVREDTARDVQHEPARHGRHGRPRPFGGLFRLPTLRFSGAAMAMSTVVGISIATTLLLNEQQGIGRRAGVARVGTTPPPTPGTTDQTEAASAQTPTDGPSPGSSSGRPVGGRPSPNPSSRLSAHPTGPAPVAASPSVPHGGSPGAPQTGGQASAGQDAPASGTQLAGTEARVQADPSPSPSLSVPPVPNAKQPGYAPGPAPAPGAGQPDQGAAATGPAPNLPGLRPTAPTRPVPPPLAPLPAAGEAPADTVDGNGNGPAGPRPSADTDQALTGAARLSPLGRDGLRHRLTLAVAEPVTAFQAEFRLAPGESAPGNGTAWTDLPGAVVTAQQERGTLVYRFTTPPGTDVRPGTYTFGVLGARPAADPSAGVRRAAPVEGWSVSAFALDHPRAVAALGTFGPVQPLPAPASGTTPGAGTGVATAPAATAR